MNRLGKRSYFTPAQKNGEMSSLPVVTLQTEMMSIFKAEVGLM